MPQSKPPAQSRKLTILHACSITSRGGTGYMASHICRLLKARGHRVIVAPRSGAGSKVEERAIKDNLEVLPDMRFRPGLHPVTLSQDILRMRRCIRANRVQIVNAWHSIEYWTSSLAVIGTRAKLARTRGLVTPLRPHFFNRMLHRRTAALFATCRRIEDNYRNAGFTTHNLFYLNDGVDTIRFQPGGDPRTVRAELGISDNIMLIANIGRLQGVKGQETFLRAMASLPPDVHAVIAGDGPERDALLRLARDLKIQSRVHFLGVRRDIPAILAAADIYTLCSIGSEGSSRATLEAMACGLPCVTTMVGMLPDIIKPGRTGLLFSHGNVEELVECLENLLRDQGLRRRLGSQARAFIEEHHSEDAMVRRVEEVYFKVLGI